MEEDIPRIAPGWDASEVTEYLQKVEKEFSNALENDVFKSEELNAGKLTERTTFC
jgi:hypothetical protein